MGTSRDANYGLPALGVGVGLRRPHMERILAETPDLPFFEFCPENYMDRGGKARRGLLSVAERYPVVSHGVGLGIGSVDALDWEYLRRLKALLGETGALWASDHLCWNRADGRSSNDLLPLPFTAEAVAHTAARIREVQDFVEVPFLVENISTYTILPGAEMDEATFTRAVLEEADCGLLLDVNNVYVNFRNHGTDPHAFLAAMPAERVGQMHMAGHDDRGHVVVDTHGAPVRDEVWALFREALAHTGPTTVLLEWDSNIPSLERLLEEADAARAIYDEVTGAAVAEGAAT
jgi:uncharacterized protein (UPF0276 family)